MTFSVTAGGTLPLSIQWRFGGMDIPGETFETLVIGPVSVEDAGNYDVVVTNACGSTISKPALLVVQVTPVISSNPLNQSACEGDAVIFTVSAEGTPPLSFQWRFNGIDIPSESSETLTIDPVSVEDRDLHLELPLPERHASSLRGGMRCERRR